MSIIVFGKDIPGSEILNKCPLRLIQYTVLKSELLYYKKNQNYFR
jgi:hypothetical protein